MHAIFIIARRPKLHSRRPYLKDTWHKIPWTALTGRLFGFTILICGWGNMVLIKKKGVKSNHYKQTQELGLWMGVPSKKIQERFVLEI